MGLIRTSHLFVRCDPFSGKEEVLDLIIHNFDACSLFSKFWVGECIGSDHYPIHALYQFRRESLFIPSKERRIEKTDWEMFEASLSAYASSSSSSWKCKEEIDAAVEALSSGIVSAFHDACPLQDERKKKRFKFTKEIREKVKEKRRIR
jgi:phosphopantetheinyl transferase (holo-ACP synthase)